MRTRVNIVLLFLFFAISVLIFVVAHNYKETKIQEYKVKYLETMAYSLNNEVQTLIQEKQNATLALALAFSQNNEAILSLFKGANKKERLRKLSERLRDNSDFKNVWIQLLDANAKVLVRSWSDIEHQNLRDIREDIKRTINKQAITSTISVGEFDMSFKASVPIFDPNNNLIGALEVISHFNSIAKKIQERGYEAVVLVDKRYTPQIKHPFSKKFVKEYYVANGNADTNLLTYMESHDLESFISKEKIYTFDKTGKYFVVNHTLFDVDDKPMANFLMLRQTESLSYAMVENMKIVVNFVVIILLLIFAFLLYLVADKKSSHVYKLNKIHMLIFTLLYLFISFVYVLYVVMDSEKKEHEYVLAHNAKMQQEYENALQKFSSLAQIMYELTINKPSVLACVDEAYVDAKKDAARKKLYELLKRDYEYMKTSELRQLHFQLKNNESFLRFHRPERYGDNLTTIRKSIAYVNENHVKVEGFEEGRIYNGFRYVFPLFKNLEYGQKSHIGSVEVSFNAHAIAKTFLKNPSTKIAFLLNKELVKRVLFRDELDNYEQSPLTNYVYDSMIKQQLEHSLHQLNFDFLKSYELQKIEHNVLQGKVFSLSADSKSVIYTIIPVKSAVSNEVIALFIVQTQDMSFIDFKNNFYILLLTGLIIITLLFLYVLREYIIKHKLHFILKKMQNIFDFQQEIVIISNGKNIIDANKQLLDFFGVASLNVFKESYNCICDAFMEDEKVFHLKKIMPSQNWIEVLDELPQKERIVMMQSGRGNKHIFSVMINHFNEDYIVSFSDISDTILEQFLLQEKVHRDMLTGTYNREFFDANIELFFKDAKERGLHLGVVIFDIDHFKNVNDTFGHACGDEILIELTHNVKRVIRKEDALIRWGGEEFVLLIPVVSLEVLEKITNNIRANIAMYSFSEVKRVTCSFGITLYKENEKIEESLKRADKALYEAKMSGRNRVCSL